MWSLRNRLKHGLPMFWMAAVMVTLTCLPLAGCSHSPAARIERVLTQCASISRQASSSSGDSAAQAAYVARQFQAVDVSGCPPDFRVAFQEHVNAWSQAQMSFGQNTLAMNFLEGAVAGATENYGAIGTSQRQANAAQREVNATYYRLTSIAAAYGARIPRSALE